jgi:corrinoid protein of di/trimethylamine methyltransferase
MRADIDAAIAELEAAIEAGDEERAPHVAEGLLGLGAAPNDITAALSRAMERLGEQFQRFDIFVPDLLIAADAFEAVMRIVSPAMLRAPEARAPRGRVVLGVVEGDVHSLGKDLVRVMLTAEGFEVHDLGRDVKVARFLEAAREHSAHIIGMSALMTTTMERMRDVVDLLVSEGVRDDYRVMVGGAPITRHFADRIGADGYAEDAPRAVALANCLVAAASPKDRRS